MSELTKYYSEILSNTDSIFYRLRKRIEELARELLLDGVYIEKVWASVTCCDCIHILAWGYDDDGDLDIHARWDRLNENVSDPYAKRYELVDVEIKEVQ